MFNVVSLRNKIMIFSAIVLAIAMLAAAALSFSAFTPVRAAEDNQPAKKTLNTTGTGTVNASPDIAYVTLGVVTENKDAKVAQQDNAKAMDKVVTALKNSGIKNDDIKTLDYNIYPKYDYDKMSGVSNIIGYTVNNSVQVTVRDITKTGSIIDLAAGSGVNLTSNISFGLSDYDKYYNEALKKALGSAKIKAESMAGVFGIKLGVPVTITENSGYTPVYSGAVYAKADAMASAATPVQAGTLEIRANVSVVYEY